MGAPLPEAAADSAGTYTGVCDLSVSSSASTLITSPNKRLKTVLARLPLRRKINLLKNRGKKYECVAPVNYVVTDSCKLHAFVAHNASIHDREEKDGELKKEDELLWDGPSIPSEAVIPTESENIIHPISSLISFNSDINCKAISEDHVSSNDDKHQKRLSITSGNGGHLLNEFELPSDVHDQYSLGVFNLKAGNIDQALEIFDRCLQAPLDNDSASFDKKPSDIATKMEERDFVHHHHETALQLTPVESGEHNSNYASILVKKAYAVLVRVEKDEALHYLDEALLMVKQTKGADSKEVITILTAIGYIFLANAGDVKALQSFTDTLPTKKSTPTNDFVPVYFMAGLIHERINNYGKALNFFTIALLKKKTALEQEPRISIILRHLGAVHFKSDNYNAADACYAEAFLIMKRDTFDFEESLNICENIADIHRKMNQLGKAIVYYEELLERTKVALGKSHEDVATALCKLGCIYVEVGSDEKAIACFKKEGRIRSNNESDLKIIAAILIRIGAIKSCASANDDALKFYHEAINHLRPVTNNSSRDVSVCEARNMDLADKLKQCEEGLRMQDEIEKKGNQSIVAISPHDVADTINDMGNLYMLQGSYKEAICCYESSLRLKTGTHGYDQLEVVGIKYNVVVALLMSGARSEAMEMFEAVVEIQRLLLDDGCIEVAQTLKRMGNIHLITRSYMESVFYYEKALKIEREKLGACHSDVLGTMSKLGVALFKYGAFEKSCKILREVLDFQKKSLGEKDLNVASTLNLLGTVCAMRKTHYHIKIGIDFCKEALQLRTQLLGKDHILVGKTLSDLADIYFQQNNFNVAESMCRNALKILKESNLPPNHKYMLEINKRIMRSNRVKSQT